MRKLIKLNLKLTILTTFLVIIVTTYGQYSGSVSFDQSQVIVTTQNVYDRIDYPNSFKTTQVGAPELPVFYYKYVIPIDAEITNIIVNNSTQTQLTGTYYVYPAQHPVFLDGSEPEPFVEPDPLIYNSSDPYPGKLVEIHREYSILGYKVVNLIFYPFEYIPDQQLINLYTNVNFTIEYTITSDPVNQSLKISEKSHNTIINHLSNIVMNPDDLETVRGGALEVVQDYDGTTGLNIPYLPNENGDRPEYIIITTENFKEEFNELAKWKTKKGVPTLVITTDIIYQNYQGCDNAQKIFNYLKDVNQKWPDALYILLGGDENNIPARITTEMFLDSYTYYVSDLYYSDVWKFGDDDYDWNQDNDNRFGYGDGEEDYLDLGYDNFLGRAPVSNEGQVLEFVNKIINYENANINDYVNNVVLLAGHISGKEGTYAGTGQDDWMNPTFELLPIHIKSNTIRIYEDHDNTTYNFNGDYELNKANTIEALKGSLDDNNKYHIIAHVDHSGYYTMGTGSILYNEVINRKDIDNIYENPIYQIIFSGGCHPNNFAKNSFSEHFINNNSSDDNNLGVAFIGNTGPGWSNSESQCHKFFNSLYNEGEFNLGKAFALARSEFNNIESKKNLNFLGDPEMPVWTDVSSELTVNIDLQNLYTGNNNIEITITNQEVEGQVCLYKETDTEIEVYGSKPTVNGVVSFTCKPETPGILHVTVTSHNFIPFIHEIDVLNNPNVNLFYYDHAEHDGDNVFEAGENVDLDLEIKNTGNLNVANATATLTTSSSYVTISTNLVNFGNINTGSSAWSSDYFEFKIAENTPDQEWIKFEIEINDGSNTYTDEFYIKVQSPVLEQRNNIVVWTTGDDKLISANDEVYFDFEILNSGSIPIDIIETKLIVDLFSDPYIGGIIFDKPSYNIIDPLTTEINDQNFKIKMKNFGMSPTSYSCTLQVTDSKYREYIIDFTIQNCQEINSLHFTSSYDKITLLWDSPEMLGYNIYRFDPTDLDPATYNIEDEDLYSRLNLLVNEYKYYDDYDINPYKNYYYKVSSINLGGAEGELSPALKAYTGLPYHTGWPLILPVDNFGARTEGSPIAYDVNNNGNKEIFLSVGSDDQKTGGIFAFTHDGVDLYNPTENIDAFYEFDNANSKCTPAIGDIDQDGICDIVFTSATGKETGDRQKIFAYSTNNPPEKLWNENVYINSPDFRGAVLSDLDNNGTIEIIEKGAWGNRLFVLNGADGENYNPEPYDNPWPKMIENGLLAAGESIPVVADIDGQDLINGDLEKEIIIGFKNKLDENNHPSFNAGIYIFNHDGTPYYYSNSNGLFFDHNQTGVNDRMDSPPVVVDMDNDGDYEILFVSASDYEEESIVHVFALHHDKSFVTGWGYIEHDFPIGDSAQLPVVSVGDVDRDENIEVFIADKGYLHAWEHDGSNIFSGGNIQIEGLESKLITPLLADIDGQDDIEIIIAGNNKIHAYKLNGQSAFGWPIQTNEYISATPFINDIDNDGYNELIATSKEYVHVWDTEGDANKTEWGAYRFGPDNNAVYEAPVCDFDPNPIVIEYDETWGNYDRINSNVIISNGATLTITGRRAFVDDAKIIVEVGSKLIIDGGVLTNACDGLWKGIEVWGNPLLPQIPLENQGYIFLKNGAVIKNAETAIAAIKIDEYDTPDYDFSGGIVLLNNSSFINNKTAVALYPYSENYFCSFYKCKFKTTQLLYDKEHPNAFVSLSGVKGVFFEGCEFSNTVSLEEYYPGVRGFGIFSFNADYVVKEACLYSHIYPCNDILPSSFSNLCYGILALGSDRISTVRIKNNEFVNNYSHIFLSGLSQAEINMNNFTLNSGDLAFNNYSGIYLDYCTGYQVEENSFVADDQQHEQAGIVVNNSGIEPNEVYNNYFENLGVGVLAQEQNRNASGIEGLQIKCNDFSLCEYDIAVTPEGADGIAASQGSNDNSPETSANNMFTNRGPMGTPTDIDNEGDDIIYFYPPDGESYNVEPLYYYNVTPDESLYQPLWTPDDGCPSNINNGILIEGIKAEIQLYDQKADSVANLLQQLEDGGDTEALNTEVQTSWPDEAYEVYSELMAGAPYLSDSVMVSGTQKENVLSGVMVADILSANPHAAKSDTVMDAVNNRINPLTDEQIAEINQGLSIVGAKELLQANLAQYKSKRSRALNELLRYFRNDTLIPSPVDSIITLLNNENKLWTKYALAFEYLRKGDSVNVVYELNNIPISFNLTPQQNTQHQLYEDYFEVLLQLDSQDKTVFESDSTDIAEFYSIYNNASGSLKAQLRNLLISIDTLTYSELYIFPNTNKSAVIQPEGTSLKSSENEHLIIYPNPTNSYIVIEAKLKIVSGNDYVLIREIGGKQIKVIKMKGKNTREILNGKNIKSGLYIATLYFNGNPTESVKFTVSH